MGWFFWPVPQGIRRICLPGKDENGSIIGTIPRAHGRSLERIHSDDRRIAWKPRKERARPDDRAHASPEKLGELDNLVLPLSLFFDVQEEAKAQVNGLSAKDNLFCRFVGNASF